jgi:hypothetical protein
MLLIGGHGGPFWYWWTGNVSIPLIRRVVRLSGTIAQTDVKSQVMKARSDDLGSLNCSRLSSALSNAAIMDHSIQPRYSR